MRSVYLKFPLGSISIPDLCGLISLYWKGATASGLLVPKTLFSFFEKTGGAREPGTHCVRMLQQMAQLEACCEEISNQRAATEDCIHDTFRRIREVVDFRETQLIGQLDQLRQGKLEDLAAQRDQIEATLGGCLHAGRH